MAIKNLLWPALAGGLWLAVFLLVPGERLRRLLPVGLLGGLGLAILIQAVGVTIFHFWSFTYTEPSLGGVPIFFPVAWFGEIILFVNFLPLVLKSRLYFYGYLLAVANGVFLVDWLMVRYGYHIPHLSWNYLHVVSMTALIHGLVAYAYLKSSVADGDRGRLHSLG